MVEGDHPYGCAFLPRMVGHARFYSFVRFVPFPEESPAGALRIGSGGAPPGKRKTPCMTKPRFGAVHTYTACYLCDTTDLIL